jgi:hypothetical protein
MRPKILLSLLSLFLLLSLSSTMVLAEYRVFLLRIAKKADRESYRLVQSTLDPLQYPYYHPIQDDEIVTYDQTWRCPGNTGGQKPLCPPPELRTEENTPVN